KGRSLLVKPCATLILVWCLVLAPWGGLCVRSARAADPLTVPLGPLDGEAMRLMHDSGEVPGNGSDLPDPRGEIIDENEESEESEDSDGCSVAVLYASVECLTSRPLELVRTEPRRDRSGRTISSPILRC